MSEELREQKERNNMKSMAECLEDCKRDFFDGVPGAGARLFDCLMEYCRVSSKVGVRSIKKFIDSHMQGCFGTRKKGGSVLK